MKDFKSFCGVCRILSYTLVSLFLCYKIVMLSDGTEVDETEVDETVSWFVKVLTIAAFVLFNFIGWATTLPEKEQNY